MTGAADISRRDLILAGAAGLIAADASEAQGAPTRFSIESAAHDIRLFDHVHEGLGTLGVRFFDFGRAPSPASFLVYTIPVGGSEGVHTHGLDDPRLGAFDEYYYILEGKGEMMINGKPVIVAPGDHIHTPLGVAHGIANIDPTAALKVFLTYIDRAAVVSR
jgi:mannose-6-phosphate isomerase-like protein (cupin superfamily)